jgi:hypothetical protein
MPSFEPSVQANRAPNEIDVKPLECWGIIARAQVECGDAVIDTSSKLTGILAMGGLCVVDCSKCPIAIVRKGGKAARKIVLDNAGMAVLGLTDFLVAFTERVEFIRNSDESSSPDSDSSPNSGSNSDIESEGSSTVIDLESQDA